MWPPSKLSPDLERRDGHLGRAEQHAVDGVEVALHSGEDVGERLAIVLRLEARQLVGERLGGLGRTRNKELHAPAIDDGVVGASHGDDEAWCRRGQGSGRHAVDDVVQWEMKLMRLVQSDLEAARGDLYRAGEARCRRIDDGEGVGRNLAGLGDMLDQRGRRSAGRLRARGRRGRPCPDSRARRTAFPVSRGRARGQIRGRDISCPSPRPKGSSQHIASRGRQAPAGPYARSR